MAGGNVLVGDLKRISQKWVLYTSVLPSWMGPQLVFLFWNLTFTIDRESKWSEPQHTPPSLF